MDNLAILELSDADRAFMRACGIEVPEDSYWPLELTTVTGAVDDEFEFFPGE